MKTTSFISSLVCLALCAGCASPYGVEGPRGPRLVSSGRATETGQYAEVGIQFTSPGDFVALVSPSRWKNPVATGGTLSWLNPVAWSDDAGRTGRILLGEAAVAGGIAAGIIAGNSSSSGSSTASGPSEPESGTRPMLPGSP